MQSGWIHRAPSSFWRLTRRYWRRLTLSPRLGGVCFGDLRRITPISREFGLDRGQCIDRYYIESFLSHHASDINGHVLEIGDDSYTRRFGGGRVSRSDVLNVRPGEAKTTLVADLADAQNIRSDTFDCIVVT